MKKKMIFLLLTLFFTSSLYTAETTQCLTLEDLQQQLSDLDDEEDYFDRIDQLTLEYRRERSNKKIKKGYYRPSFPDRDYELKLLIQINNLHRKQMFLSKQRKKLQEEIEIMKIVRSVQKNNDLQQHGLKYDFND